MRRREFITLLGGAVATWPALAHGHLLPGFAGYMRAPIWSVWAVLEGTHSEKIFEGSSEDEVSNWINTGGQAWLEERKRKRNA